MKKLFYLLLFVLGGLPAVAQDVCDSIAINKVMYDPFEDSVIIVQANNYSNTFVSYPIFTIMTPGATVAQERLMRYGMMGESSHMLNIKQVNAIQNNFHGYLLLDRSNAGTCVFEREFSLCPDTCQMVYPTIGYYGPTSVTGTLDWTLERNDRDVVASGQLALSVGVPSDLDSICLTPGSYNFKIKGFLTPGEQPFFSLNTRNGQYFHTFYDGNGFSIPFQYFKRCPDATHILKIPPLKSFDVYATGWDVHVVSQSGNRDQQISISSTDGRIVYRNTLHAAHNVIPLSHMPAGVYIVRIASQHGFINKKVLIGGR
ncbi:MAG: T9SS type A sorting domain-containing protein [Sphingobacteriales bacterium]|nr:MAG: T9SS type A sorting domain-containing protein [Sphingobacteriales bacterium]